MSKLLIFFSQNLQFFSNYICSDSIRSDWAVIWFSLVSIKSEQVSKMCFIVKSSWYPVYSVGFSPFIEKEWVIIIGTTNVQSGYHWFIFSVCSRTNRTLLNFEIFDVVYFPGTFGVFQNMYKFQNCRQCWLCWYLNENFRVYWSCGYVTMLMKRYGSHFVEKMAVNVFVSSRTFSLATGV